MFLLPDFEFWVVRQHRGERLPKRGGGACKGGLGLTRVGVNPIETSSGASPTKKRPPHDDRPPKTTRAGIVVNPSCVERLQKWKGKRLT